jgi:hypothetical protein
MMERFAQIPGIIVPGDPLPMTIEDKTIVVFPRIGQSVALSAGRNGGVAVQAPEVMQVEYHRRIPYEHLGSTMGDITSIIDSLTDVIWSELAGGKFDGTISNIQSVSLAHFGAIGWNEWTFGARLDVAFTHLMHFTP